MGMLEDTAFPQKLVLHDPAGFHVEAPVEHHSLGDKNYSSKGPAGSTRTQTTKLPLLRIITQHESEDDSLKPFGTTHIDPPWTTQKDEIKRRQVDEEDDDCGVFTVSRAFRTPAFHHLVPFDFGERQRHYFIKLLREKWKCLQVGHTICVLTEDGQHLQISDGNLMEWVDALCYGNASTSQPPKHFFDSKNVRVVSVAPSYRLGINRASKRSLARFLGSAVGSSFYSDSTQSSSPSNISVTSGTGHSGSRKLKWLGSKIPSPFQNVIIAKRAKAHVSRLEKWKKSDQFMIGTEERAKVLEMLEDALELSRPCYPSRVNMLAYSIGKEVRNWLHSHPEIPQTPENSFLLIQVQICLIPILLTRISRDDPLAGDLAWETLGALTRAPLALQGPDMTAAVVCLVAREFAYSKCSYQHSWLGVHLLRIVEMTLEMRTLTHDEQTAIWELAIRRQQGPDDSRPWEVALFALCTSQNKEFKDVVLGEYGLQSLLSALDKMLSRSIPAEEVRWENVALTLRALAFLSERDWVVATVLPEAIASLLGVFRRSIPERFFSLRFWAMDTIHNILSYRPSFIRTLVQEGAEAAFATLTAVFGPKTNANPRSTPDTKLARSEATANRLMEEYKKEASKRAVELCAYIAKWRVAEPETLPRLRPVSITKALG